MKRKYSSSSVEWEYIGQLENAIENQNTRNQVSNALEWYIIKASRYRMIEYCLNAVIIAVPAILVVLSECVETNCIASQLFTAISGTFAASAKSFSKLHDKRICYRRAAEEIKSETVFYIHKVGIYKVADRDTIFVNRVNEIRRNENSNWAEIEGEKRTESITMKKE